MAIEISRKLVRRFSVSGWTHNYCKRYLRTRERLWHVGHIHCHLAPALSGVGQFLFPIGCNKTESSVLLQSPAHQLMLLPEAVISDPGALPFWNCCEIRCPGFKRILRRITWFTSLTWNLYKFQEETQELESAKPVSPASLFPFEKAARVSTAVILKAVYLFQVCSFYRTGLLDSWVWIHFVNQLKKMTA